MKLFDLCDIADELTVAVVSDTHGQLDSRVAEVVSSCDAVIHAGDFCGAAVVHELGRLNSNVIAVAGNNDIPALWPKDEASVVSMLPKVARMTAPGGEIIVEHGHRFGNKPDHEKLREAWPDARLIVYGHTHIQVWDREQEPWVLNPGAAGYVRNQGGPSCIVLRLSQQDWDAELMRFRETLDNRVA
jgi:putative phosphoesterase